MWIIIMIGLWVGGFLVGFGIGYEKEKKLKHRRLYGKKN